MKCNKQQKIAFGLLGLAVVAFLGDRFVLGGGSAEELAIAAESSIVGIQTGSSVAPAVASASLPMAVLARRMEEVCAAEGLNPGQSADAFTPPASWFPAQVAEGSGPAVSPRAHEMRQKYKVTAIMRTGRGQGIAVIQGQTFQVGQTFQGFKVQAIRDRAVVLSDGQEQVELELPESGLAALNG